MPRLAPTLLQLTEPKREYLQQLVNRYRTPQQVALRANISLLADEGLSQRDIARELTTSRDMARLWRNRWLELGQKATSVVERLADAPRSRGPITFSLEQILQLFTIACEKPEDYGRPINHWTAREWQMKAYLNAIERANQGGRTVCLDEMTDIQALERKFHDKPCVLAKENDENLSTFVTGLKR